MHIIYFTSCHFFIFLRCHFNTTTTKMFSNIHKQRTQLYPKYGYNVRKLKKHFMYIFYENGIYHNKAHTE